MRGKLCRRPCSDRREEDHPRRCGENPSATASAMSTPGSPPQVRGKLCMGVHRVCAPGITPAGAGKTTPKYRYRIPPEDHPRRCGENFIDASLGSDYLGSPPQVRGKHQICDRKLSCRRITPAGAGKTKRKRELNCPMQDHPRRCGENSQ